MTTPDTSAVRTWARKNGYDVADRGRLPAEVTEAYLASHGGAKKKSAPAKKATTVQKAAPAAKTAPPAKKAAPVQKASPAAKKAAPVQKASPAKKAVPQQRAAPVSAPAPKVAEKPAEVVVENTPRPKPSPVNDDRRLVALGEEIKALTQRVEALEKNAGGSKAGTSKAARFRRRS